METFLAEVTSENKKNQTSKVQFQQHFMLATSTGLSYVYQRELSYLLKGTMHRSISGRKRTHALLKRLG